MLAGNTTVEKSFTDCWNPIIWYGVPACTLGSDDPMWILWIITSKSMLLPVSGSTVCTPLPPGLWHMMHSGTIRRAPPCAASGSWQRLQFAVAIRSCVFVTCEPFGTNVYTLSE